MRQYRSITVSALMLAWLGLVAGCAREDTYPSRPITIVCPWAAGGGTDRVSRQMAMHLEQELGVPVNVVNATGGKGVTGHNRGLRARPDGYTLTMMTFELNTMHWIGLTELTYLDCEPLLSVNEDYAALLLRDDAPWQSLQELEEEVRGNPKKLTSSGTAVGGAWHLALAGWLNAAGFAADDIVWVPSAGANPSLQQLISGGVDMVCCSLPEARTLLESGEVRALGVMAPTRAKGFDSILTFAEQGRDWTLGGWRGLGVPKGTPPQIVDRLTAAVTDIVARDAESGTFAEFMESQKFDNTWRKSDDFVTLLRQTDEKLGTLLTSDAMRSVSEDRFSPNAYPTLLAGLAVIALLGIVFIEKRLPTAENVPAESTVSSAGIAQFCGVIAAIVAYLLLVETVGFVILATGIVVVLLMTMGTRPLTSLVIGVLFVPAVFGLFAYLLRVPLPRGWLG